MKDKKELLAEEIFDKHINDHGTPWFSEKKVLSAMTEFSSQEVSRALEKQRIDIGLMEMAHNTEKQRRELVEGLLLEAQTTNKILMEEKKKLKVLFEGIEKYGNGYASYHAKNYLSALSPSSHISK